MLPWERRRDPLPRVGRNRTNPATAMTMPKPLLLLPCLVLLACTEPQTTAPVDRFEARVEIADADVRVLFIGNSLIYHNDLPVVVGNLSDAAGLSYASAIVAQQGWSLEEHWDDGVARVIGDVRADIVVLQQGPAVYPYQRDHLVEYAGKLAPVIRAAGGEPALLMVWPDQNNPDTFTQVRDSYRAAAEAVSGIFIPAGETWMRALALEPDLVLWGPDRTHPTQLGTMAAAMATFAVLFEADAAQIPDLPDDLIVEEEVATLRSAVELAIP